MRRIITAALTATMGSLGAIALIGMGCRGDTATKDAVIVSDDVTEEHVDRHPPTGATAYRHTGEHGWTAYAASRGPDQGMELHLEKAGKRVTLPDAVPLGFSPDGAYLLLVWTSEGRSGLAAMRLTDQGSPYPRLLTDAHVLATPGHARDIRWDGSRVEYDLPSEDMRLTVGIDLATGDVTTRPMGGKE